MWIAPGKRQIKPGKRQIKPGKRQIKPGKRQIKCLESRVLEALLCYKALQTRKNKKEAAA